MDQHNFLLSIIVPTKNRYYYLKFLVNYFHETESRNIELIIQDNSDKREEQKEFYDFLNGLNDSRITYSYHPEPVSVIENSDRALEKATGEYVTFIGDDDIFSRHIIRFTEEIKSAGIEAVLPVKSSYAWPDIQSRFYGNKLSGKFTQTAVSGEIKKINTEHIYRKLLDMGGTDILNLPRVYHGIVKRALLLEIYRITGSYFPGPSPDMANAVALTRLVQNYISIDIPFVISGHSSKSTGGQGAAGRHFGEVADIKHLPKNTAKEWAQEVPFYWSGYTIYAESVIQALKRMGFEKDLKRINFNYLYASCLVFDTPYKERVLKSIREAARSGKTVSRLKIYQYYLQIWARRISFHLRNNMVYVFPAKNGTVSEKQNILEVAEQNDADIEVFLKANKTFLKDL